MMVVAEKKVIGTSHPRGKKHNLYNAGITTLSIAARDGSSWRDGSALLTGYYFKI
jgi:hypothetical protein